MVVEISTEVYTCCSSRSTVQWIFIQHLIVTMLKVRDLRLRVKDEIVKSIHIVTLSEHDTYVRYHMVQLMHGLGFSVLIPDFAKGQ